MGTQPSPILNSVFFYSWGKFSLQCEGIKEQVSYLDKTSTKLSVKEGLNCGSAALPTGYKPALTSVNTSRPLRPRSWPLPATGVPDRPFPVQRVLERLEREHPGGHGGDAELRQ